MNESHGSGTDASYARLLMSPEGSKAPKGKTKVKEIENRSHERSIY